ncbi:MAG: sigma-70 family RNA polymerase sigma factor [Planctomycetota bacterium]
MVVELETQEQTDAELYTRYLNGEEQAFAALYHRLSRGLFGYGLALTGNREVAADALQDAWMRLLQGKKPDSIKAYLYSTLRNRIFDLKRRGKVAAKAEIELKLLRPKTESFEDGFDNRKVLELNRAISALPQEQLEVVLLRAYEGMKFNAIAEVIGVPVKTAESRYRLALDKLKQEVTREGN